MTRVIADRSCRLCGEWFTPTAFGQKYCGRQKIRGTCSWKVGQAITKKYLKDNPHKHAIYVKRYEEKLRSDPVRSAHDARVRHRAKLKRHGMSEAEYDAILESQRRGCAICGTERGRHFRGRSKRLAVDHDHASGNIRGLLCDGCNIGIGLFGHDPTTLRSAADYLEGKPALSGRKRQWNRT